MTHKHRFHVYALATGALVAGACLVGCKDEPPKKLFEEAGVWSLTQHDVDADGSYTNVDFRSRGDAFLLRFDADHRVVQAAMCAANESDDPSTSLCKLEPSSTWFCKCFGYDFVESEMAWREFPAGSTPPEVSIDDAMSGGGGGGDEAEGGSGGVDGADGGAAPGTLLIQLAEIAGKANTYRFQPLPHGTFGSDGVSSGFVFQQKASSVFEPADEVCTPCI